MTPVEAMREAGQLARMWCERHRVTGVRSRLQMRLARALVANSKLAPSDVDLIASEVCKHVLEGRGS